MRKLDMFAYALVFVAIIVASSCASAQQRRFYDARGNSVGTASTDSQGTTVVRDSRGNVVGTSSRR
jgi:YD repeat-containing protein